MNIFIEENFVDNQWIEDVKNFLLKNIDKTEKDNSYQRLFLDVKDKDFLKSIFNTPLKNKIENFTKTPFEFVDSYPVAIILNKKITNGLPIHTDFKGNVSEWIGFIYLNNLWQSEYGGELTFWEKNGDEYISTHVISPIGRKLVLFKSSTESYHSVSPINSKYNRLLINFILRT